MSLVMLLHSVLILLQLKLTSNLHYILKKLPGNKPLGAKPGYRFTSKFVFLMISSNKASDWI